MATIIQLESSSFSRGGHRVMRFEMYVRDGELGEVFENRFRFFHKYPVSVQCTQTHVVLLK